MKLHDQETQDLAQAVQDVLEGKVKNECADEKDFKPHMMYDPKTGKGYKANTYDDHVRMDKMGYTHEAPKETYTDIGGKQHNKVKGMHPVKKTSGPGVKEDIDAAHEEALAIEEARQLKDPKKEVMVVKNGKVEVINKKDLKKFMAKGYGLAEDRLDEAIKPSDPASMYGGRDQIKLGKYLKKLGAKGAYFDGNDFVGSMTKQYSSKTTLAGALNPKNDYTVQDLIDALKSQKEDVTIQLPTESSLSEKKATIDLDLSDDDDMKKIQQKYKVKFKKRRDGGFDVTGETKNLHKLLKGDEYAFDQEDIEDMFPEVLEAKDVRKEEQSDKQKKYQAFFDKALKKFGVKSPSELEGDKKKEFFDYVDANYEADNETD